MYAKVTDGTRMAALDFPNTILNTVHLVQIKNAITNKTLVDYKGSTIRTSLQTLTSNPDRKSWEGVKP